MGRRVALLIDNNKNYETLNKEKSATLFLVVTTQLLSQHNCCHNTTVVTIQLLSQHNCCHNNCFHNTTVVTTQLLDKSVNVRFLLLLV